MNRIPLTTVRSIVQATGLLIAALALAACQNGTDGAGAEPDPTVLPDAAFEAAPADTGASAGKPTAPISIDYTVIGTAIVGQPLSINLEVSSKLPGDPVTLNYRINDVRELTFPPAQAQRVALGVMGDMRGTEDANRAAQQVIVVPQKEGRLYLNVSAEVETEEGTLLKSIAIPIQVGSAPRELQTNGEPGVDSDGEAIVSMPAEEKTPE
jgi:hypothetical protein